MAGDWIKMRANLHTHPKIVRMASALGADRLKIVGGLHAVWCLFDAHSEDGRLDGYTLNAIDQHIGFPGFSGAMERVSWLVSEPDGITLPQFDTHNGQSAKRRATDADRKRQKRAGDVVKPSASGADKKRTREEERRGINTPHPPAAAGGDDENRQARKPRRGSWRWQETWEGFVERGKQLGIPYSTATLGNGRSWTDDEEVAHKRAYKEQVIRADRDQQREEAPA